MLTLHVPLTCDAGGFQSASGSLRVGKVPHGRTLHGGTSSAETDQNPNTSDAAKGSDPDTAFFTPTYHDTAVVVSRLHEAVPTRQPPPVPQVSSSSSGVRQAPPRYTVAVGGDLSFRPDKSWSGVWGIESDV
jgi:hypothetical protein